MRLVELEAKFIGGYKVVDGHVSFRELPDDQGAQGVLFVCPKCQGHSVICWFSNPRNAPPVPAAAFPRPGRWAAEGSIDNLTLMPSVDLSKIDEENPESPGRCYWHGWVTNGEAA
jgi:hypothetical protein